MPEAIKTEEDPKKKPVKEAKVTPGPEEEDQEDAAEAPAKGEPKKPMQRPRTSESGENLVQDLYFGTAEKTVAESSYHPESLRGPYNTDDLFVKAGDYSIYEDMLNDDQVSVCLKLKKDLVIGAGWDIVPEDESQDEMVDDIKVALAEDPSIPFDDSMEEILSAYEFGFSLTEKIFKFREDGALTLNALKTRHPSTWLIWRDQHGNIEKYEQHAKRGDLKINPKSLIHFIINRKFQNPYGRSDLRSAYNAWFTKRQIIRYYAIFLEKAASPTPVARYDTNAPPEAIAAIHAAIQKFQTKTALTIPKEIEVEFLETSNTGEAYEKAIDIFNTFIGRSLFIPDLLGFHGEKTSGGSLALGKEQMSVFVKHIQRRRKALEDTINNEIIWPIIFYNYGDVDNYPKFKLRPVSDSDAIEYAKIWLDAVKGKIYEASDEEVNHFRNIVKFPEGDVTRAAAPMEIGPDGKPLPGQPSGGGKPPFGAKPGEPGEEKPETGKKPPPEEDGGKVADKKQFAMGSMPPGEYAKKCDFKMIARQLSAYDEALVRDAKPIVAAIYEDLFEQIQKKRIIQSGNASKIDGLKLKKLSELKRVVKKSMRDVYIDGKQVAHSEIFKQNFAGALAEDEFLDLLEKEIYDFIGDWEYNVTKKARVEIISALKDGKPVSSVISQLSDEGINDATVSIERYARTKHTEVFNKGRLEYFEKSGVVAAYQYSAIIDNSTSDICAGLDGKIFEAGTEPVPPMHFNCRSLLVPITKFEDYKVSTKAGGEDIDDFIEENKGKGFSTR